MDLCALDPHQKNPQVSWGVEQKVYLCCLFRFFEKDLKLFKRIFDLEFQQEIRDWGFTSGVPSNRLTSQWSTMCKEDPIWGHVCLSPFDRNGCWASILESIETMAKILGLELRRKEIDDTDTSQYNPKSRLSLGQKALLDQSDATPSSAKWQAVVDVDNIPPSKRRASEKLCNGSGKLCLWCSLDHAESTKDPLATALRTELPPLLYRWSNIDTQGVNSQKLFLAGMATDSEYFSPGEVSQEKFNSFVSKHVHREKTSSPFISTMMSLMAPLHRALRHNETAIISIIDPMKLGTDTPVFSAHGVMSKMNLKVNGYYNGKGEYLIWWKVPSSAIVCSFKINDLRKIINGNPDIGKIMQVDTIESFERVRGGKLRNRLARGPGCINMSTGELIGRMLSLLEVPRKYAPLVGEGIVHSWCMRQKGLWREFEDGISQGYHCSSTPLVADQTTTAYGESISSDNEGSDGDGEDDSFSDDSGTVRSSSPAPQHPTVSVQIFNPRKQTWVDQQPEADRDPSNEVGVSTISNHGEDEQDTDLSIHDTEDEASLHADAGQDLFEIGRARIRELFN